MALHKSVGTTFSGATGNGEGWIYVDLGSNSLVDLTYSYSVKDLILLFFVILLTYESVIQ